MGGVGPATEKPVNRRVEEICGKVAAAHGDADRRMINRGENQVARRIPETAFRA
jgi:hypothetical protein